MTYIKKLVMQGFKSFAKKTEIPFDKGINIVLGPNGSGKSNISDALCFVLGRLSMKSMRAAKSKNMLFMGSPFVKPAREASVEIVFDNSDKTFNVERDEISIERIVKHNGQGAYRINGETKTRTDVIEMLAHAGIDPYGFNIILQGQIQSIVKMHPEDRRKIVEEVAGISIYESRKEKSLRELGKTDERLKEINAILRERTSYLRNLDNERAQALKFKELEETGKRCKTTILNKKKEEKLREIALVIKNIEQGDEKKGKAREKADNIQKSLENKSNEINNINKDIQKATGVEQDSLKDSIADLRAELEGLRVRKDSYENRKREIEKRIEEMNKSIPAIEREISELKEKSPLMAKKTQDLKRKKEELAVLEEEKKKILTLKSELNSLKERIKDKEMQIARATTQGESLLKQIEENSLNLIYKNEEECAKSIIGWRTSLASNKQEINQLGITALEYEKSISISNSEIKRLDKIKNDVNNIDICPLCQSNITEKHIEHVSKEAEEKINEANEIIKNSRKEIESLDKNRKLLSKELEIVDNKIIESEHEINRHRTLKEKNELLKKYVEEEKILKVELQNLEHRRKRLEEKSTDVSAIEEKYENKMFEIEEISSITEENVDNSVMYKGRDLEAIRNSIKRNSKDIDELKESIEELEETIGGKDEELESKEEQEEELNKRFNKMFEHRDKLQTEIQKENITLNEIQQEARGIEDQINYLKIGKAKLDAEREAVEMELGEFVGIELLQGSINVLEERLFKVQESLRQIGSINMRALEVYEEVKKEYDIVHGKVEILLKEKEEILKIIEEIDKKKLREFTKTFKAMNQLFSENFSRLSSKGTAFLEIEDEENIFDAGVNIVVRLAKGKYFDVTSLSGGEQTLVALSLLFAIQEHKPYHFYIFDEIDAALDKRNSERLAALLNQYMKAGQYVVITHNDAIIMNSDILYGVSMHDGVSKILSLKLDDKIKNYTSEPALEVLEKETRELAEKEIKTELELDKEFGTGEIKPIEEDIKTEVKLDKIEVEDSKEEIKP
ncbi:MAG: chromosome segregation SMC family protein [archaeon]|nr:chromosome segregation SMC family protein [archaeon]